MIDVELLSDDPEIIDICTRYWERNDQGDFAETVKAIGQRYHLKTYRVTQIVQENCVVRLTEPVCSVCGEQEVISSRTALQSAVRGQYGAFMCDTCQRAEREARVAQRLAELERQRDHIRSVLLKWYGNRPEHPIDPSELSLSEAVYLVSLVRMGGTEDFGAIRPLKDCSTRLAPTPDMQHEIIADLRTGGLLDIHPGTDPDSVIIDEERVVQYYFDNVWWQLRLGRSKEEDRLIIEEVERMFAQTDGPAAWDEEYIALCRKVALDECIEYLQHQMGERGFSFSPGEKTYAVLDQVLDRFSVGQVYRAIYASVKNASDYFMKGRVPKRQAANSVVGHIQRYAERARDYEWDVRPFRRDFNCPRTMISEVLFSAVLQVGDAGFTDVINFGLTKSP